jgi:hypothetical protein
MKLPRGVEKHGKGYKISIRFPADVGAGYKGTVSFSIARLSAQSAKTRQRSWAIQQTIISLQAIYWPERQFYL